MNFFEQIWVISSSLIPQGKIKGYLPFRVFFYFLPEFSITFNYFGHIWVISFIFMPEGKIKSYFSHLARFFNKFQLLRTDMIYIIFFHATGYKKGVFTPFGHFSLLGRFSNKFQLLWIESSNIVLFHAAEWNKVVFTPFWVFFKLNKILK